MPLDAMTLRRLLQARPELLAGATQPTTPTVYRTTPQELAEQRRAFDAGEPGKGFIGDLSYRSTPGQAAQGRELLLAGELPGMRLAGGGPPADILSGSGFLPESLTRASERADEGFGGGLWDRVKGFFEPDEEPGSYDDDLSSAGWAGAAQAAAEASSNPQLSPIQILTQSLAGYSGARARAKAGLRGEAREERLFGLKERELTAGIEAKEFERQQARDALARQEQVINDLPPELQGQARALLAAGAKERFGDLIAPKPSEPYSLSEGQTRFGPNGEVIASVPKTVDPLTLSEGQVAYGPNGEVIARGPPKTYAPQAPQAQYELEGGVRLNRFSGAIDKIPGAAKLPPIGELQAYRDSLPPGPARDEVQAQIDKLNAKGGGGAPVKAIGPDGKARFYAPETVVEQGLQPVPEGGEDKTFANAKDLRTAYLKQVADVQEVVTSYRKVEEGAKLGTGAGDLALIFGYMKMLDPISAVREGEQANAANAAGVPESIRAQYNRFLGEGSLSQTARNQLLGAARTQIQPYRELYNQTRKTYTGLAERANLDPTDVVTPIEFPAAASKSSTGPVPRSPSPPPGTPMIIDPNDIMNQVGIR